MSTETLPPPVRAEKKKARKKTQFVVKLNGIPCGFLACPKVFGPKLVPRRGVLVQNPNLPTLFPGEKSAHKAAGRAARLRSILSSAVFTVSEKYQQFVTPGDYKVHPVE